MPSSTREIAQAQFEAASEETIEFAAMLLADELLNGIKDKSELSEDELKKLAKIERRDAAEKRVSPLDAKIDRWAGALVYGGFAAAVIMIWNILCHTGHWVWMGRKEA